MDGVAVAGHLVPARYVNVAANDVIAALFKGHIDGGAFEVRDKPDRLFHFNFQSPGEGHGFASALFTEFVDEAVEPYELVVAVASDAGDEGADLDGGVEDISVKKPVCFAVELEHELVAQLDGSDDRSVKSAEDFVVVAREVIHLDAVGGHLQHALEDGEVRDGKVVFAELPDVDKVPVDDEYARSRRREVFEELVGMAAVGAQVGIGDDDNIRGSNLFHMRKITGEVLLWHQVRIKWRLILPAIHLLLFNYVTGCNA